MVSFKSVGLIAVSLSLALVGCGSDDDKKDGSGGSSGSGASGGTGASGGSGGTAGGGSGGTAGTSGGGSGGSGGDITCGSSTCTTTSIVVDGNPLLSFPPCCAGTACGSNVDEAEAVLGVTGCMELEKPGTPDSSCVDVPVEIAGSEVMLPGCCMTNNKCGVAVDITELGSSLNATGPNFGCQDPTSFVDGYVSEDCGS
ncbi:MAG: hypothetical protein KIT72_06820 [Polyangiaceae bacterium]|nr:hypothetical protein [Polyangiaceae bacterium]MCW5790116.1 hypothetical protein [Polyangiaceae bacterium]